MKCIENKYLYKCYCDFHILLGVNELTLMNGIKWSLFLIVNEVQSTGV